MLFLYLDPGTGSLLIYALIGIATTFVFFLKRFFSQIKVKVFGKISTPKQKYGIVIHSEGSRYFSSFKRIIDEFISHEIPLTYITSQKDDLAFGIQSPYFTVICPGNEYQTYTFLNNLEADLVISTTPHLDIYMWKKSKNVKKYIHIFHAPSSIDFYEKYALSFYDIIFTTVKQTEEAQIYLDKKRNCQQKKYIPAGCPYLDEMFSLRDSYKRSDMSKTVLYAPSWGTRSSLKTSAMEIINTLLSKEIKVIFRPHPQSFISDKKNIDSILNCYKDNPLFILDSNNSGLQSMTDSDALITDFSGILFDYKILFNKPIFLASDNINIHGYEIEDIPEELQFDIPFSKKYSIKLSKEVLENIDKYLIDSKPAEAENNFIYNAGNASKIIFENIIELWQELK